MGSKQFGLGNANVDSAELAAILRVPFGVESYLLAFGQRLETIRDDRREMHKNIVASVVIGDKAEAFIRVKPFYSTVIHKVPPIESIYIRPTAIKNHILL